MPRMGRRHLWRFGANGYSRLIAVIGRQVIATAKPPDGVCSFFFCDKEAHIGMGRWSIGVLRMNNQRNAHGLKTSTGQFRAILRGGGGHLAPKTWEKLTPPFSITGPSTSTRLRPPPPSSRIQLSSCQRHCLRQQRMCRYYLAAEQVLFYRCLIYLLHIILHE